MSDPQDIAESTDEDKVDDVDDRSGDRVGEALADFPPDGPRGAEGFGITPTEEDAGESLIQRVAQEQPDPAVDELERAGGPLLADAADEAVDPDVEVGQLVEDVGVVDDEEQPLATEEPGEVTSPEESAMHIEPR